MWQIWMSASWEMQCKAPAQMHFIIAVIITDYSLEMWDSCFWGVGRISLFLPCMFRLHYFSDACQSVWKKLWGQIHCLHGSLYHDGFNDSINQVCVFIKFPGAAKETNHWPSPLQADWATCSFSLSQLQLSSVPQSNKNAMTDLTIILLFSWGAYFKHLMGLKSAIWILLSNFRRKAMICWPSKDKFRANYTFSYPYNNLTSIK